MRPKKTRDANQYTLPWGAARQERQAMIRAIVWERTGLTRKRWANAVDVLCYFVSIEGQQGTFPKQSTIAAKCRMSTRTVKRVIQDLVTLEILISKRRGSTSNEYTIDCGRLASLGMVAGPKLAHQPGQIGPSLGPKWPISGAKMAHRHIEELAISQRESNSSSTSTPNEEEEEEILNFKKECREHKTIGALLPLQFDAAVAKAMANGCTVHQLYERMKWFAKNRSNWPTEHRQGAVYCGLADATPALPADQGWPYKNSGSSPLLRQIFGGGTR